MEINPSYPEPSDTHQPFNQSMFIPFITSFKQIPTCHLAVTSFNYEILPKVLVNYYDI